MLVGSLGDALVPRHLLGPLGIGHVHGDAVLDLGHVRDGHEGEYAVDFRVALVECDEEDRVLPARLDEAHRETAGADGGAAQKLGVESDGMGLAADVRGGGMGRDEGDGGREEQRGEVAAVGDNADAPVCWESGREGGVSGGCGRGS